MCWKRNVPFMGSKQLYIENTAIKIMINRFKARKKSEM
jgi:hypothetical protein